MKGPKAIGKRPAYGRECPFRTDQTFLNRGVALGPGDNGGLERLPGIRRMGNCLQNLQQHWLNDKAVVVVPMELRPVAIDAVAFVPLLVFPDSVVNPHGIPTLPRKSEEGFDGCAEEQPVVKAWSNHSRRAQRLH